MKDHAKTEGSPTRLDRLTKTGIASWSIIGVALVIVAAATLFGLLSGIIIPLIIAFILGALLEPVMRFLENKNLSSVLAALITLSAASLVTIAITWFVIAGFVQQIPEMYSQTLKGWASFVGWVQTLDVDPLFLEQVRTTVVNAVTKVGAGTLGIVASTLSGTISLAMGAFFAAFFLFFMLRDRTQLPLWFARVTGTKSDYVVLINEQINNSFRAYFKGTALTALMTAPLFMIPVLLLKLPLVVPIFIIYFFLSFIPYVGALITGVFAVLIAFSAGGLPAAIIILVSLLISNSVIQNVIMSWLLGSSLKMHPVLVLLSTLVGGAAGGLLGMVLGPPLLAATTSSIAAVKKRRSDS